MLLNRYARVSRPSFQILKREALLDAGAQFSSVDPMLDGLERSAGRLADLAYFKAKTIMISSGFRRKVSRESPEPPTMFSA